MKADNCATRVWLFNKRLVLHLVEGFVKKMQNNKTKPNNRKMLRPMCLVHVLEKALSSSPGATCMHFHLGVGKRMVSKQGQ